MKLSHKKKLASKCGKWWPFTRQMRIKRESTAVMCAKSHAAIVRLSMVGAAAARLAQAIVGMKKKMEGVTSQCKSWLVRDPSQQQPANQNKGLLSSFCQQKPQNEIKIKINHKMS